MGNFRVCRGTRWLFSVEEALANPGSDSCIVALAVGNNTDIKLHCRLQTVPSLDTFMRIGGNEYLMGFMKPTDVTLKKQNPDRTTSSSHKTFTGTYIIAIPDGKLI